MKRSVVLCGSQQKKEGLYGFYQNLVDLGVAALRPDFEGKPESFMKMEESERVRDARYRQHLESFVRAHLERIRGGDICFIYNEDGKFGVNTRLEFDYARRLGKPIFSLLPLPARHQDYIESVVQKADDLLPWLGEYIAILGEPHRAQEVATWSQAMREGGLVPLEVFDTSARSLHRMNTADIFYVFNPEGRINEDLVALLGSAIAHGKPIYAFGEDPVEACCNTFFHPRKVQSPEELHMILNIGQQALKSAERPSLENISRAKLKK